MKIFDCFKFFNEYEILELRFMTLYDHVDYFVLVESNKTHTGKPKPWNFEERKDQYAQWLDKVIYVKVEDLPDYSVNDIWKAENFQRNCIARGLDGVAQAGDKIFVSDCDEIWNPETAQLYLNHTQFVVFQQKLFYYFVNCRQNQLWNGTCMATYGSYENPQQLRNYARSHMPIPVLNGGWHYSFMGSAEKIKEKVENIAESHLIINEVGDIDKIQTKLNDITDLWDRTDDYAKKRLVDINANGPKCLYKFIEKYPSYYKENK